MSIISLATLPNSQRWEDGSVFPFVYVCETPMDLEASVEWVASHRDQLLAESTRHGAVLLRGFAVPDAEAFDAVVAALSLENFPYKESLSNAVRVNRTERVFTANEAPATVDIFLHHEMAQTPIFPERIFFFCEQPAESGGATPICRSDVLLQRLTEQCPQFVADVEAKGLKYTNVMPSADDPDSGMGRSWQSTLGVETKDAAEARLADLGYSGEWLPDGCLRATTPCLPGIRELPDGRRTFFNQLIAAFRGWKDSRNDPSKAIRHGNDDALDVDALTAAAQIADDITFDVPWQHGDVALIDNTVVMHGRRTFTGTRKVLASLAEAKRQ